MYLTCDIVDNDSSLCSSVIHRCKAVVSLLSGCVPDLKLDRVVIDTDCLSEERSCSAECKRQSVTRMRSHSRTRSSSRNADVQISHELHCKLSFILVLIPPPTHTRLFPLCSKCVWKATSQTIVTLYFSNLKRQFNVNLVHSKQQILI